MTQHYFNPISQPNSVPPKDVAVEAPASVTSSRLRPSAAVIHAPTLSEIFEICEALGIEFIAAKESSSGKSDPAKNPPASENSCSDGHNDVAIIDTPRFEISSETYGSGTSEANSAKDPTEKYEAKEQELQQQTLQTLSALLLPLFEGRLPNAAKALQVVQAGGNMTVTTSNGWEVGANKLRHYHEVKIQNDELEGIGAGAAVIVRNFTDNRSDVVLRLEWQEQMLESNYLRPDRRQLLQSVSSCLKGKLDRIETGFDKKDPSTDDLLNDPHLAWHKDLRIIALGADDDDIETRMETIFRYIMGEVDLIPIYHCVGKAENLAELFEKCQEKRPPEMPAFIAIEGEFGSDLLLTVGAATTIETLAVDLLALRALDQKLAALESTSHLLAPYEIFVDTVLPGEMQEIASCALAKIPNDVRDAMFTDLAREKPLQESALYRLASQPELLQFTDSTEIRFLDFESDEDSGFSITPPEVDRFFSIASQKNPALPVVSLHPARDFGSSVKNKKDESFTDMRAFLRVTWANSPRELDEKAAAERWVIVEAIASIIGHPAIPLGSQQFFDSDEDFDQEDANSRVATSSVKLTPKLA